MSRGFGLAALSLLLLSCRSAETEPVGRPVNVLLVTLDTTRADRIGCYGNERIDTPSLDELARQGTLFENAFATVPSTLPSHASILTGTYPAWHGIHDNALYVMEEGIVTLSEVLQSRDYRTGAFVSAYVLDSGFGLAQGFEVYDDEMSLPIMGDVPEGALEGMPAKEKEWVERKTSRFQRRADEVTPRAVKWLKSLGSEPFFLWVHYFDPHQPYQAPDPWGMKYDTGYDGPLDGDSRLYYRLAEELQQRGEDVPAEGFNHMVARYDGEVAFMDEWLGHLFQAVRDTGRWKETLVIVLGDHGESFGEHALQIWEHNRTIYDEVMRIPLLVRRPDGVGSGRRVPDLVRTVDIVPTVLEWLSMEVPEQVQGRSLLPLTAGEREGEPAEILMEALRKNQLTKVETSFLGLRTAGAKLIFALHPDNDLAPDQGSWESIAAQLFDVSRDPGETRSLYDGSDTRALDLSRRLVRSYRHARRSGGLKRSLDSRDREALRSLGYIQ